MLDSNSDSTLAVFSMHREIKLAKEHADKKDKSAFKACLRNCQTEAISFFQGNPEKVNAFASEMRAIYNAFKSNKKKDTNDLLDEQLRRCESAIKQITFEACLSHGTELTPIRRLMELYELTMQSLDTSERMQILKGLILSVEEKDGLGHMSLSVFLTIESDYEIISTAAMSLAVLFPVRDGDELSGPKYVANTLLNYEDNPKEQGAQFAGLILLGDKRVLPILEDTWQKISPTAQLEATRAKSSYMTEAAIDFWLWCIENCDNENIVGSAVATLAKMPSIAAAPFVFDSERIFPSYAEPEAPIRILNKTPLIDYLKKIDPHLKYLISKESEPKVIPMIYDYWGNSDPTSEETPHEMPVEESRGVQMPSTSFDSFAAEFIETHIPSLPKDHSELMFGCMRVLQSIFQGNFEHQKSGDEWLGEKLNQNKESKILVERALKISTALAKPEKLEEFRETAKQQSTPSIVPFTDLLVHALLNNIEDNTGTRGDIRQIGVTVILVGLGVKQQLPKITREFADELSQDTISRFKKHQI